MTSKAFRAVMTIVVETTAIVGVSSGNTMPLKTCHSVAPSTRAASRSSGLMPLRAADRMTIAKPVHIQAMTMINRKVLKAAVSVWSQEMGWKPKKVTMASSVPVCGCPADWYSNMNRQMTEAAVMLIASGTKMTDLATGSYRTRSTSTAMIRPSPTVMRVRKMTQMRLLRTAVRASGLDTNHE